MAAAAVSLSLLLASVAADYGDPRKGACATGDSKCKAR
jgi:hypothetical protein